MSWSVNLLLVSTYENGFRAVLVLAEEPVLLSSDINTGYQSVSNPFPIMPAEWCAVISNSAISISTSSKAEPHIYFPDMNAVSMALSHYRFLPIFIPVCVVVVQIFVRIFFGYFITVGANSIYGFSISVVFHHFQSHFNYYIFLNIDE